MMRGLSNCSGCTSWLVRAWTVWAADAGSAGARATAIPAAISQRAPRLASDRGFMIVSMTVLGDLAASGDGARLFIFASSTFAADGWGPERQGHLAARVVATLVLVGLPVEAKSNIHSVARIVAGDVDRVGLAR